MTSHDIIILTALVCVTAVGITYLFKGGDGLAMSGSLSAIALILGYKIGNIAPPSN